MLVTAVSETIGMAQILAFVPTVIVSKPAVTDISTIGVD